MIQWNKELAVVTEQGSLYRPPKIARPIGSWRPNFIEEAKISGTLLRYVLSYCFLDTSLPYYLPLFLCN